VELAPLLIILPPILERCALVAQAFVSTIYIEKTSISSYYYNGSVNTTVAQIVVKRGTEMCSCCNTVVIETFFSSRQSNHS